MNGDPLDLYCQYISRIIDIPPSTSPLDNGVLSLLEEAARRFCGEPCFKNERSYVRIWLEYASLVPSNAAEKILAFMLANNVGIVWPHLYEEYALTLEQNNKCVSLSLTFRVLVN